MSETVYLYALLGEMQFFEAVYSLGGPLVHIADNPKVVPLGLPHLGPVDLVVDDFLGHGLVLVVEVDRDVVVQVRVQKVMSVLVDLGKADHGVDNFHLVLQVADLN